MANHRPPATVRPESTPRPTGPTHGLGPWFLALCCALGACSANPGTDAPPRADTAPSVPGRAKNDPAAKHAPNSTATEGQAVAYFAGGCFWGVEYFLEQLPGVVSVESGYMGGHIENPSYEQVSGHQTGHLESVRVTYDPNAIDYERIARRFFEIHDPTQANGQGPDIGPQYLSAVFVANDEERQINEKLIEQLRTRGYDVVTEIKPVTSFYDAESYHQDYYVKHQKKPYCHAPVDRFGAPARDLSQPRD